MRERKNSGEEIMSNFDQIQMIQNSQISDPNRTTLHPLQPRDFMYRHRNMPLLGKSKENKEAILKKNEK